MKIISAKDGFGNNLTVEQIKEDLPRLQQEHNEAKKKEATWNFFGGVLQVNGHVYQIV